MRQKREPESDARRAARIESKLEARVQQALAEEISMDAAVRNSIRLYGA